MCPHCGAELERIPTGTLGCYDVICPACEYTSQQVTTEGLEEDPAGGDYHPLVDGRRAGYGDEEVATCDDCGRPFLAAEASWSIWNGKAICPRCHTLQ